MQIPHLFEIIEVSRFDNLISDLVADNVHGIHLPYLTAYPEITNYAQIVEAQQFMRDFSEVLLELNNQNESEVQKLLDKLKMDKEKHSIFTRIVTENFSGMTKAALYSQIAMSKYVLIDFNWNLNITVSSDKISKSQIPTIIVELKLKNHAGTIKRVIFEMNKQELEHFVTQLHKVQNQL